MDLSVIPNTDQVKDEVRKHFLHLQESHNRHDEELKIKAKYKFKEVYLVANNTKKTPMVLKPTLYWIFTFGIVYTVEMVSVNFVPYCALQNTKVCKQHWNNTSQAQNNRPGIEISRNRYKSGFLFSQKISVFTNTFSESFFTKCQRRKCLQNPYRNADRLTEGRYIHASRTRSWTHLVYLSIWKMKLAFRPIEINRNLYFTQHWDNETSHNFTDLFLVKRKTNYFKKCFKMNSF